MTSNPATSNPARLVPDAAGAWRVASGLLEV